MQAWRVAGAAETEVPEVAVSGGMLLGVDAAVAAAAPSWALVAHATASNAGSSGVGNFSTPARNTATATLLAVAVAWYNGGAAPTLTDSLSNTWSSLTAAVGGNGSLTLFYKLSPAVGGSQIFTVSGSSFASCAMAAFSGGGSAFDQSSGAGSASAPTQQPGSITPTMNGELLLTALCCGDNGITLSVSSPYSITDSFVDPTNTVFGVSLAWQGQALAAPSNPTWTCSSGSHRLAAAVASFKA